jgi:hypothetical protein
METRIIRTTEGKVFRRIHDGFVMGNEIYLGYDHSTGEERLDLPEYYEEIIDENIPIDLNYIDFEPSKLFEVCGSKTKYLELLSDYPELGIYRKQTNLQVYYNGDMIYFYTNMFQPGHREILQNYLIIKERNNYL